MKDQKRAYRRYKKEVHLKRRAKNIFHWMGYSLNPHSTHLSWADFWEEVKSGEKATWLRTTGNPCNCFCCSKDNKYVRPQRQYMFEEREYKNYGETWKVYKE